MGFISSMFQRRLVGLDVGVSGIKAVELQGGKRPRLLSYNRVPLPWDAIQPDGEIREHNAVVNALKTLFESSSFTSKKVAIGASGTSIITKKIQMPKMTQEELGAQLYWEAEQYIPFQLDDVNLDFAILGDADSADGQPMMDVLLVAAKKDYVQGIAAVASDAGLDPAVVDIQPFALGNVFEFNYGHLLNLSHGAVSAMIDFGAGTTKVSIVEGDKTSFTRDLRQSGTSCTVQISQQLGVSLPEAEKMKIASATEPQVAQIIAQHCESLSEELSRTLDFYISQAPDRVIQGIYICGGASRTLGLIPAMEARLSAPIHVLNPIQNIAGSGKKMNAEAIKELSYLGAVAVGLSLRTLGDT
ncbi:MAG: type IV pilus assembly protein PilM [Bdellovibrionales bacterium]|nr:type IV pilus assembly protein PilM [Bdellovibrionales bacterium]